MSCKAYPLLVACVALIKKQKFVVLVTLALH